MSRAAPQPSPEHIRLAALANSNRSAEAPEKAPPKNPPHRAEVEVLVSNFTKGRKGESLVLDDMTEGEVQALVEAGAIRLKAQRPSVAGMKEDNDG